MKTKVKAMALLGGTLAGLASMLPLTSYAIANPSDVTITATVNPAISLDAASGFSVTGDAGEVMNGIISATVKANTQHTISFKVADSRTSTAMTDPNVTGDSIPASANVVANNNAWGIKAKTGAADSANADVYTEITKNNQVLYTSTGNSDGSTPIKFAVGISTSQSISAGSYSIDLTVTAAAL